jgi:hypothetical protein
MLSKDEDDNFYTRGKKWDAKSKEKLESWA